MVLLQLLFIRQQPVSLVVLPDLLNQYLPLQLVEVVLDIVGHRDVLSEPVDRLMAFKESHREDAAVLAIGAGEGLVGEVEEIGSEAEDGVEAAVLSEDGCQFSLLV